MKAKDVMTTEVIYAGPETSVRAIAQTLLKRRISGVPVADDDRCGARCPASKVRWGVKGRGKGGGIRVIYYARTRQGQIWMLTLYAKNVAETIPAHVLRQIKEEIDG